MEGTSNAREDIEPAVASRGTCRHHCGVGSFTVFTVAERARKNALPGNLREATEKFGPLKLVLQAIPAAYSNREVR